MSGPIQRFYQVLAPANHYFILSHKDRSFCAETHKPFAPEQVPVDWLCAARGCSNMLMVFEAQGAEGFGGVAIVQVLPSTY